nr:hypothetical protein [Tanacetum cinerariifolium]
MHRALSSPRTPNPATNQGESSAPRKPTFIRFRIPRQPNIETRIPTTAKIDINGLYEATRVSIATQRSLEDLEAQQNVEKVQEHLVEEEIEMMVEGTENVDDDEFMNEIFNDQEDPGTRRYGYMFRHLKQSFIPRKDFNKMADAIKSTIKKVIPSMVDKKVNKIAKKLVSLYVAEGLLLDKQKAQTDIVSLVAKAVDSFLHDYMSTNILHVHPTQAIEFEKHAPHIAPCRLVVVRTRDHEDHYDDDARPEEESSAKRQKTFDHGTYSLGESLTEQVTKELNPSGSGKKKRRLDIANSKEAPNKPAIVYQSYERDPKAPPMTLLNQDLFYLKYDSLGPKKYVPSLHRYPTGPFPKNDLEELTSRWSKIVEVVRTLYDLGHEYKYITKIVVRRADGKFGAFSESDYKYLHKNDIEDLSCVIWERVHDYQLSMKSYQQKVNLVAPTITFPGIERKKVITITSKQVAGLIYENKKKRVMIINEIPKFCDAALKRVLELVENKNIDVKHGGSPSSQFEDVMTKELRLKREVAFEISKEKDHTVMRLEEMKFLTISTKYLPDDGSYFIEEQKEAIRAKYNLYRNRGSNPGGSRQSV